MRSLGMRRPHRQALLRGASQEANTLDRPPPSRWDCDTSRPAAPCEQAIHRQASLAGMRKPTYGCVKR
jgi:hypothetical protein